MKRHCPECGNDWDGVKCSACLHSATAAPDPDFWRCVHEDRGQRCGSPGVVSPSTHGTVLKSGKATRPPFYCWQHVPTLEQMTNGVRSAPPMGFAALRKIVARKPFDFEAEAERLAIQSERKT